ncbi:MAG TPA: hypothetical protein VL688_09945 [Verrucomicrobiae bacterium]|nr:hypothetical protein [Verrucomicrobiae bacterium]
MNIMYRLLYRILEVLDGTWMSCVRFFPRRPSARIKRELRRKIIAAWELGSV